MALPTLPANTIAQITGVSSRVNANPNKPPITRVNPTLLNSLQNWMVKTMPTNDEVNIATPMVSGPMRAICCNVCCMFSFLCHTTRFTTNPSSNIVYNVRHKNLGGSQVFKASFRYSATASPAASSLVANSELPSYFFPAMTTPEVALSSPAAVASLTLARATEVHLPCCRRPTRSTDRVKHGLRTEARLGRAKQMGTVPRFKLPLPTSDRLPPEVRVTIDSVRARATTGEPTALIASVAMPWTRPGSNGDARPRVWPKGKSLLVK